MDPRVSEELHDNIRFPQLLLSYRDDYKDSLPIQLHVDYSYVH